jgi:hypothetical protein
VDKLSTDAVEQRRIKYPEEVCGKLIPQKCGKVDKAQLFSIKRFTFDLSTFYVDKFVKKCAEMSKYI